MCSSKQRMLDAFNYNNPDKIPVIFGWSDSGLYVHGKKLLDLFNKYQPDNPVDYNEIPKPPESTIDKNGEYHEKKIDVWNTEWEYRIFGIVGHPSKYPFESWETAADYKFPEIPEPGKLSFEDETKLIENEKKKFLSFRCWISGWEKLHSLRPMDEALIGLALRDAALLTFLDRLVEYQSKVIEFYINAGADVIIFGDDWGTQTAPIISPDLFREIYKPVYKILFDIIHKAGKTVMFHSCGNIGVILDELLELGIDGFWPQIGCYDLNSLTSKLKEHKTAMYIHPDRQYLIPKGSPEEIEKAIIMYCDHFKKLGGGGIFNIEVENDAPFENVKMMIETIFNNRSL